MSLPLPQTTGFRLEASEKKVRPNFGVHATMSVSVQVPGQGCYDVPVGSRTTADDVISRAREHLPSDPWHGNKLLSCGPRQLKPGEHVSHAGAVGVALVLANYSELSSPQDSSRQW